jgi:hypothetical protein
MAETLQWAIATGLLLVCVAMVMENLAGPRDIPFIRHNKDFDSAADRED